jgi:hypothetical protein
MAKVPKPEEIAPPRCRYCGVDDGRGGHAVDCVRPRPEEAELDDGFRWTGKQADNAVYLATEAHLKAIENALCSGTAPRCRDAMAALEAIREAGATAPADLGTMQADAEALPGTRATLIETIEMYAIAKQHRDFLDRACASYIERLAGEKVAGGFMSLAVASAWASEQKALVNAALAHIGEDAQ